jgi:hypothetical protein
VNFNHHALIARMVNVDGAPGPAVGSRTPQSTPGPRVPTDGATTGRGCFVGPFLSILGERLALRWPGKGRTFENVLALVVALGALTLSIALRRCLAPERGHGQTETAFGRSAGRLARRPDEAASPSPPKEIPQLCKRLGITEQTFYRWRLKFGTMSGQVEGVGGSMSRIVGARARASAAVGASLASSPATAATRVSATATEVMSTKRTRDG